MDVSARPILSGHDAARPRPRHVEFLCQLRAAINNSGHGGFILKPAQVCALEHVYLGHDTLVLLPTGYGKSIIFQILPWLLCKEEDNIRPCFGIVLVVSPLNSLILDQIEKLSVVGVPVGVLQNSISTAEEKNEDEEEDDFIFEFQRALSSGFTDSHSVRSEEFARKSDAKIYNGECALVYTHPETLVSPSHHVKALLLGDTYQEKVVACVIDEAHCIVEWGSRMKAFRPDFGNLAVLRSYFPKVPVVALTATAPPSHINKIKSSLQMKDTKTVSRSPDRPNIFYAKLVRLPSKEGHKSVDEIILPIAHSLKRLKVAYPLTIIYMSLKWCGHAYRVFERVLGEDQYVASNSPSPEKRLFAQFHAPQEEEIKVNVVHQIALGSSVVRVVFATSALGMGVDAPNIQEVVHIGPPRTLEAYFQETGRAGRNNQKAKATLYYNNNDIQKSVQGMEESIRSYCRSENVCLRKSLLEHFGFKALNHYSFKHDCCDVCAETCNCDDCNEKLFEVAMVESTAAIDTEQHKETRDTSDNARRLLKEDLLDFRLKEGSKHAIRYGGIDSVTGLTQDLLNDIVEKCDHVKDADYLLDNFEIWHTEHADIIFSLIEKHRT